MDWTALGLSLHLALWTCLILVPVAILVGRALAWGKLAGKVFWEALIALPLVLPPTVLGFYLLVAFGGESWLGAAYAELFGHSLVFSFNGLLFASLIFNIPFAVQPVLRAFEAIPREVRDAAWCSGMSPWQAFWRIELPLSWTGVVTATTLTFAHTLGEFGVVLMVGGNIPGETKTIAISIYDRVQAFDDIAAATMSALLLVFSFSAIVIVQLLAYRARRRDV